MPIAHSGKRSNIRFGEFSMRFIDNFVTGLIVTGGFIAAQSIFWKMTGRAFWRAMIPVELRGKLYPSDPVRLDSFAVLEEWIALLFAAAFAVLPMIALSVMGIISVFR